MAPYGAEVFENGDFSFLYDASYRVDEKHDIVTVYMGKGAGPFMTIEKVTETTDPGKLFKIRQKALARELGRSLESSKTVRELSLG